MAFEAFRKLHEFLKILNTTRKALTRGCTDHFVAGVLIFQVRSAFPLRCWNWLSQIHSFSRKETFSSRDLELWPMTVIYELAAQEEPYLAKYQSRRSFCWKIKLSAKRTDTAVETDCNIYRPGLGLRSVLVTQPAVTARWPHRTVADRSLVVTVTLAICSTNFRLCRSMVAIASRCSRSSACRRSASLIHSTRFRICALINLQVIDT